LGKRRGGKKLIISGREDVFLGHPGNDFNSLILNWCIGSCWFTLAFNICCVHFSFQNFETNKFKGLLNLN
jgi:hypothetical protein